MQNAIFARYRILFTLGQFLERGNFSKPMLVTPLQAEEEVQLNVFRVTTFYVTK